MILILFCIMNFKVLFKDFKSILEAFLSITFNKVMIYSIVLLIWLGVIPSEFIVPLGSLGIFLTGHRMLQLHRVCGIINTVLSSYTAYTDRHQDKYADLRLQVNYGFFNRVDDKIIYKMWEQVNNYKKEMLTLTVINSEFYILLGEIQNSIINLIKIQKQEDDLKQKRQEKIKSILKKENTDIILPKINKKLYNKIDDCGFHIGNDFLRDKNINAPNLVFRGKTIIEFIKIF